MPIAGLVLIIVGGFVMKEVIVGRTSSVFSDAKTIGSGIINFDMGSVASTLTNVSATDTASASLGSGLADAVSEANGTATGSSLLNEVQSLGSSAKGYELGATGPSYYDCSGLVWQALRTLGLYDGPRFTTATFDAVAPKFAKRTTSPSAGDIINWPSKGHMGVYMSTDLFYSAMNPSAGIGQANISTFRDEHGNPIGEGEYWSVQP